MMSAAYRGAPPLSTHILCLLGIAPRGAKTEGTTQPPGKSYRVEADQRGIKSDDNNEWHHDKNIP